MKGLEQASKTVTKHVIKTDTEIALFSPPGNAMTISIVLWSKNLGKSEDCVKWRVTSAIVVVYRFWNYRGNTMLWLLSYSSFLMKLFIAVYV